jgi:hypothetical protein
METKRKKIIVSVIVTAAIAFSCFILAIQCVLPYIVLNTQLPNGPSDMPVYKVLDQDTYRYHIGDYYAFKDLPTDEEAIHMAYDFLTSRDLLPEDAVFHKTYTMCETTRSSDGVVTKTPIAIFVSYSRVIDSYPVVGLGDFIDVHISRIHQNINEVVTCQKYWRMIEYADDIEIISAEEAYQKLLREETIEEMPFPSKMEIFTINEVFLGYYSNVPSDHQEYYWPVWVFRGTILSGNQTLSVNACK